MNLSTAATALDFEPTQRAFFDDIVKCMRQQPRRLPCKYFYDERGSRLFDEICKLDEYYLTRSEMNVMRRFAPEMAEQIGANVMLIEYGSGSSLKTRILLDHLSEAVAYVPVDISREHLQRSADRLSAAFAKIEVLPVCADFTKPFDLPRSRCKPSHCAVYFPGSTIGNFTPESARELLMTIAPLCGAGGGLLIGIDLQKDVAIIEAAYNDRRGVTADFNLNILRRINNELDADFDLRQFDHRACYNKQHGRVEMYLISRCDQTVTIGDQTFELDQAESICTEHSHKYTIDGFAATAAEAGLTLTRSWTDEQQLFAVLHLAVVD